MVLCSIKYLTLRPSDLDGFSHNVVSGKLDWQQLLSTTFEFEKTLPRMDPESL